MVDTAGVKTLIGKYMEAYQRRDIEALAGVVAADETFMAFGTDEGERWIGWDDFRMDCEKLFCAVQELHWTRGEPEIRFSRDGNVAWFAEDMRGNFATGGEKIERHLRLTGIAEKRDGAWVIVQFHRSAPLQEHAVPYLETHGVRFD